MFLTGCSPSAEGSDLEQDLARIRERPEIVVYAPAGDGERKLDGVEYAVPYSAWGPDESPPRILGQDLKRADGLQLWYLHIWLWEPNEKGLFADWNPAVDCPGRAANR